MKPRVVAILCLKLWFLWNAVAFGATNSALNTFSEAPAALAGSENGKETTNETGAELESLEKGAQEQDPMALLKLGEKYMGGDGVSKDEKRGVGLLLQSAVRGNAEAQRWLAAAYGSGTGVAPDLNKAMDFLEASASAGNATAQLNLGDILWNGSIGHPDYPAAFGWISNSAALGISAAAADLGTMYEEGIGVKADMVESLKWLQVALNEGFPDAKDRYDEVRSLTDTAQREEAQRRVNAFKAGESHPVFVADSKVATSPLGNDFQVPTIIFERTNHLLVDTGSTYTFLDVKYQPNLGDELIRDRSGGLPGVQNLPLYSCPEILLDGKRIAPLWASCTDCEMFRQFTGESIDGILGMDSLQNRILCFDSDSGIFSIGGSVTVPENAVAIPIEKIPTLKKGFGIEGTVNGFGPVTFVIDSGGDFSVAISKHDWQRVFGSDPGHFQSTDTIVFGGQVRQSQEARVKSLVIGANTYTNLIGESSPDEYSRLGRRFLKRHLAIFDFPHRTLYLSPGKHFLDADEADMSGIESIRINGETLVRAVRKGCPAATVGIAAGDKIVSINGRAVDSLPMEVIRGMLKSAPNEVIKIEIQRDKKSIEVSFRLKRLV